MTTFRLPVDTPCTCARGDVLDAVTGHANACPTHAALMAELFKPQPKDVIMENQQKQYDQVTPAAPPNVNWRVIDRDGNEFLYYAPHCNADAQGLLAVGGPGVVLAIFAPGEWSRIENLDAMGADGVARVAGAE